MKHLPLVLVFAIGVGVGVGLHGQFHSHDHEHHDDVEMAPASEPEVFQPGDAVKNLQEMESDQVRNSEANQMLADLLKLFMVDVALRISENNKQQMGQVLPAPKCPDVAQSLQSQRQNTEADQGPSEEEFQVEQLTRVVEVETQSGDLRNPSEEKDFVDGTTVDNVFPFLKNTALLPRNQVKMLEGTFIGEIQTQDKKFPVWKVEYSMTNLKENGDSLEADTKIVMSRGGKPFSNSNSNGDIRGHHKKFSGDSRAIIVESGGGSFVLQLYLVSNNQKLIGTLYKKKSVDEYLPHGVVRMTRQ